MRWFGLVVKRWSAAGKQTDPGSIHFAEMQLGWSCFLFKIVCFRHHTQSRRRFPAPSSKVGEGCRKSLLEVWKETIPNATDTVTTRAVFAV